MISGCNGHSDPINTDQDSVVVHLGQSFGNPTGWGDAYSLDSSTATWTYPVSQSHYAGDIATSEGEVDTLYTAFVKHNPGLPGGITDPVIYLIIVDSEEDVVYNDNGFSWNMLEELNQGYDFCRHPAVEVTYNHDPQAFAGHLAVHVVWAEQIGEEPEEQWDVFYRYLTFDPTDTPWSTPDVDVWCNITDTPFTNDTQPDLCVDYATGDLYAVFKSVVIDSGDSTIYAVKLPYDSNNKTWSPYEWESEGCVAEFDEAPKDFPSIDAGLFSSVSTLDPTEQMAVVWSQKVSLLYQIFYNEFASGELSTDNILQISDSYPMPAILPKVEVLPYTSGLNEAVIAWCEQPNAMAFPKIKLAVTPFLGGDYYQQIYSIGGYVSYRCPDLAGYQGEHSGFEGEGLVALAYHYTGFHVGASALSVAVDFNAEEYAFNVEQGTTLELTDALWTGSNPFTGPSICLRDPDPAGWSNDKFGLAWVEDDFDCYVTSGDTIQ